MKVDVSMYAVSSEFQLSCCTTFFEDRLFFMFYSLYAMDGAAINVPFFENTYILASTFML